MHAYIQWLETKFLGYLDEWDRSVKGRTGFTAAERKKMRLSDETLEGLRVTGIWFGHNNYVYYLSSQLNPLSLAAYVRVIK